MSDPLQNAGVVLDERALTAPSAGAGDDVSMGPTVAGQGPLLPPPTDKTAIFDPVTGTWRVPPQGNYQGPATFGEQGMAFAGFRWEEGWALLDGPSGAAGHPYNSPGFDGVAFREAGGKFELRIVDNKALQSVNVKSATALTTNLSKNLASLEAHVNQPRFNGVPNIAKVRAAVAATRARLAQGLGLPADVTLEVTNFGGASTGIGKKLRDLGIIFRDLVGPSTPKTPMPKAAVVSPLPEEAAGVRKIPSVAPAQTPESLELPAQPPQALRTPAAAELSPRQTAAARAFASAKTRLGPALRTTAASAAALGFSLLVNYFIGKQQQSHLDDQLKKELDRIWPGVEQAAAALCLEPADAKRFVNVNVLVSTMEEIEPEVGGYIGWPNLKIDSWGVGPTSLESDSGDESEYHFGWRLVEHRFTFSFELPTIDATPQK